MLKKFFAMASVGALGGFVTLTSAAGCSSKETDDGSPHPGAGAKPVSSSDPNNPSKAAAPECKAKVDFKPAETKPVAPKAASACTSATISALAEACVDEPNGDGCATARSAPANKGCAACIFGAKSDPQGKVVTLAPGEDPEVIYNQEGCVENITGVKGCGHAYMTVLACFIDYCGTCNRNNGIECLKQVAEGECKPHRITDDACVKATEEKQSAITGCFPATEDGKGIRSLFNYLATLACGGSDGSDAPAEKPPEG